VKSPFFRSIGFKGVSWQTATLYIRLTAKDGKKSYCTPVYQSKRRLKPQHAMVNGEPEHHKEGVYWQRRCTSSFDILKRGAFS
jgi:hypothetical protein